MKISIVIQYYNRKSQFLNTLNSIINTEVSLKDIEVVIVDDASVEEHQLNDIFDLFPDLDIKLYTFNQSDKWWSCPVLPINKGISIASGDAVILLCAECMFIGDIILDVKNRIKSNDYLVYGTLALPEEISKVISQIPYSYLKTNPFKGEWYQHSQLRNNCFNFCTAILKEDLDRLGGFDERFAYGFDTGDLDFIRRVKELGMNVISIDDPLTYHQWHPPHLFDEFSQRQKVSNLSGYSLYEYIIENEPNNIRVNNSFSVDEDYIPLEPELIPIKKIVNFNFEIASNENGLIFNFNCPYSNIHVDFRIKNEDFKESTVVRNNTWIGYSYMTDIYQVQISYKDEVILSVDLEKNHSLSYNIKKQIDILTHF